MLGDMLQQKREKMIWVCCVCFHDLHSEPSIICDSCLIWSHYKCVGISRQPKAKNWFCRSRYTAATT